MRYLGKIFVIMGIGFVSCTSPKTDTTNEVPAVDLSFGESLVEADGKMLVVANCTGCHSEKLITQNRATREGWLSMIRWMQAKQNLWPLGANEEAILDYLEANYAPEKKGRRANLAGIEWYELETIE